MSISLRIKVKPGRYDNRIVSRDPLVIAVAGKAVSGEANESLRQFLSDLLEVPKSFVIISKGIYSAHKVVEVPESSDINKLLV